MTEILDLRASEQTIVTLLTNEYWVSICPWLHCDRLDALKECNISGSGDYVREKGQLESQSSDSLTTHLTMNCNEKLSNCESVEKQEGLKLEMNQRGFFSIPYQNLSHLYPSDMLTKLDMGIERLVSLGHSPSAIGMYDEAWILANAVTPICAAITGNKPIGDWFTFYVNTNVHAFAGPHRDKPTSGIESFGKDGSPHYETIWIALTDSTAENSCLSFIPADDDTGYYSSIGDGLEQALPNPSCWGNIVSVMLVLTVSYVFEWDGFTSLSYKLLLTFIGILTVPCVAGSLVCFSHRVVHWGSKAKPGASRRTSLSFALADDSFCKPFFDSKLYLPFPPLSLRLALRAGQAILYESQIPLTKHQLALDLRTFLQGREYFNEEYILKIMDAAQNIKWMLSQNKQNKKQGSV
eukprot:gene9736-13102_t